MLRRTGPLGEARFAVTDRWGGVSKPPYAELNLGDHVGDDVGAVAENRTRLAAAIGLRPAQLRFMSQVHGRSVAVLGQPAAAVADLADRGATARVPPEADALVTTVPGVALVVLVADCVPVLLAAPSPDGTVVAAVHAGRRGVQDGVVPAAVDAMVGLGARLAEASAVVGPAVCAACYEVPAAMAESVAAVASGARATSSTGTPALDLPAAVAGQLRTVGVSHIDLDTACTREDTDLFSHRRDAVTGRLAALVWSDAP